MLGKVGKVYNDDMLKELEGIYGILTEIEQVRESNKSLKKLDNQEPIQDSEEYNDDDY